MNKPSLKHLIIVCGILFLILVIITVFVLLHDKNFDDFYLNLHEVDKNIDSGFYNQAGEDLDDIYNDIINSKTALMFLKRAWIIAGETGSYGDFAGYSKNIYDKYSSNLEIAAVSSYARFKNHEYEQSLDIAENKLSRTDYYPLYLQNLIKADRSVEDSKVLEKIGYYGIILSDEISPETLSAAAEENYDARYIVDQALLMMQSGDIRGGYNILLSTEKDFMPEIKMTAAYDTGNNGEAEYYFNLLQYSDLQLSDDLLFTGCDILMKNGKFSQAGALYESYLTENFDKYSLPYRNLYSIHREDYSGISWLSAGMKIFPESEQLLIPWAWEFFLNNNFDELKEIMTRLDTENNPDAELLRVSTLLAGRSPEHIIGNYWNVYNRRPDSVTVARAFAGYLLENRQFDQLDILLNRYSSSSSGNDEWVHIYSAIGNSLAGRNDAALRLIRDYDRELFTIEAAYNSAVVFSFAGAESEAEKFFNTALRFADRIEDNNEVLAKIYLKLAETNYNKADYEEASHYIRKSLDFNPDNMKGRLLYRKIEEDND